jgi:Rod binding domain-containing protein
MDTNKQIQEIDKLLKAEMPKQMRESLEKKKDILLNNKEVLK